MKSSYSFQRYIPAVGLYGNPEQPAFTGPNETLAHITQEQLLDVPEATVVSLRDGSQIRMYEVQPSGDYDESRVIVRVMDFANGLAPHSYASALAVAELLGHKVIVLPWNDIRLTKPERQQVNSGDLSPISSRQSEGLESISSDSESLTVYGYSLGAQAALGLSKVINSSGVLQNDSLALAEPPNTARRSKWQLMNDFKKAGPSEWADATRDSDWKAIVDLMGVRTDDTSEYMKKDMNRFMRNAIKLSNIAIIGAMQRSTFGEDLFNAGLFLPTESNVVIAKERYSAIVPKFGLEDAFDRVSDTYSRLGHTIVALQMSPSTPELSLGHAVGNNPFIAASLIERVVR